jgi:glycosyltransferase involved in cell wall biosynthesis
MGEIVVNGRFRGRPITGVERYASEVLRNWHNRVQVMAPRRPLRGLAGHLWEQFALPARVRGLLWSPANSGPLAISRQVITIHDLSPLDGPQWFAPGFALWYRLLLPALARRSRRVLTHSTFCRERLIDRLGLPYEKIVVIPPGVDAAQFHPVDAAPLRARYSVAQRYLLFVGSLGPRKNLPVLLRAWRLLQAKFPAMELVIAGATSPIFPEDGQNPPPGVRFLGHVPEPELPALYSGAEALIMPSLYEGFGLPLLEAMACGAPVISSTAGGLTEAAGGAALLFDPLDSVALAGCVELVLCDTSLRESLRTKGFERAEGFPWRLTAERIWAVLEQERQGGAKNQHG